MHDHPVCYAIGVKASAILHSGSSEDLQSYFKLLVDRLTSAFPEWQDFYVEAEPGGPPPHHRKLSAPRTVPPPRQPPPALRPPQLPWARLAEKAGGELRLTSIGTLYSYQVRLPGSKEAA